METSKFEGVMNETTAITSFPGVLGSPFFFFLLRPLCLLSQKEDSVNFLHLYLPSKLPLYSLSLFWETWEFESEILFIALGSVASKGVVWVKVHMQASTSRQAHKDNGIIKLNYRQLNQRWIFFLFLPLSQPCGLEERRWRQKKVERLFTRS